MGELFVHKCGSCGYKVSVTGGIASGMRMTTRPMVCVDCRRLLDLPIRIHTEDGTRDLIPACRRVIKHEVKPWSSGDPCPKCAGPILRGACSGDWD